MKTKKTSIRASVIAMMLFLISVTVNSTHSSELKNLERQIMNLVTNGSIVLHDESGNPLISYNSDQPLVPASIIKILTSGAAFDLLGEDFRFKTDFYRDDRNNLAIKGWGDPFLISEEIEIIAHELKNRGINSIHSVHLDNSSFSPDIIIPGVAQTLNPYNAINGALITNFNTLNLTRSANGQISSAEEVTPLTPLALAKAQSIEPGNTQRINLSSDMNDCLRYAGELFIAIFERAGIEVENQTVSFSSIDPSWDLFYTHLNSNDLTTISRGLQKYSNNFIANQLFLTIGAEKMGYPATLEKGRQVFEDYIRNSLQISPEELMMHEGSGISRSNTITANVMIGILEERKDIADLLPSHRNALAKSGTLTGVYNYAGYIPSPNGNRPFVIILNQNANNRDAILDLLVQYSNSIN
ncbi:D-alanyl-D-alanine carboxypeptidase [Chitinispirillales bacterium ANBcel5]|uniref:D-alanyl-D-alanine carboxypeptidase/D-alanyl-D-alanine-endopeptidase n=1 Tax=Cellulosispirillum alkaliphilum TaxID=3039283 RepID=UPI002A4F2BBC|nr:D-alanyl-D-alanine carboxypeptidase [Chitinispirillales bacterium ANBcel5]